MRRVKPLPEVRIEELKARAARIRRQSLRMVHRAGMGHPGGDLSCADILSTLYFGVLQYDSGQPDWPDRDRFVMSKGHSSGALYATLAEAGFLSTAELESYMQPGSLLSGHPDRRKVPGVEANTGPLGHGLPIGVGMAIGAKLSGAEWRTFVLTGDGELQEGSNWEAAMTAAHRELDRLTVIVDRNRLQQGGSTEHTARLEPLHDKWEAFGWAVTEVDGHDCAALLCQCRSLPRIPGCPTCIIAHTYKGQGVSFMRDQVGWHHRIPTDDELTQALVELGETP